MDYLNEVIKDLMKDEEVKKFIKDNKLTREDIVNNLGVLADQKNNNLICNNSIDNCLTDPYGMASRISFEDGRVVMTYYQVKETSENVESLFFPNKSEVERQELYKTPSRVDVFRESGRIVNSYKKGDFFKGIYIHGKFGTGKSFLLQRLAIQLSNKGASVLIAYYPDLVRRIKSSITSRDTEVIINKLKNVDVLMLDDIGAETNTNFIRDEVLGPILQYRVDAKLPVCMTSNLDLTQLKKHFSDSNTNTNIINSERIISRIRHLMVPISLDGQNYRDKYSFN